VGNFAICNISDPSDNVLVDVQVSSGTCPAAAANARPAPSSTPRAGVATSSSSSGGNVNQGGASAEVAKIKFNPDPYVAQQVSLTGTILNIGQNLQIASQRHLVLKDQNGEEIDVRIPAATEVLPGGAPGSQPKTAPQLLDQPVSYTHLTLPTICSV